MISPHCLTISIAPPSPCCPSWTCPDRRRRKDSDLAPCQVAVTDGGLGPWLAVDRLCAIIGQRC